MFGWLGQIRRTPGLVGDRRLDRSRPPPSWPPLHRCPTSPRPTRAASCPEHTSPCRRSSWARRRSRSRPQRPPSLSSSARTGSRSHRPTRRRSARSLRTLQARNIPQTSGYLTGPPAVAPDRSVQIINVGLEADTPDDPALLDAVRQLRAALGPALEGSGLTAGVAGDVASFVDNEDTFNSAFAIVGVRDHRADHRTDPAHLPQSHRRAAPRCGHRRRLHGRRPS